MLVFDLWDGELDGPRFGPVSLAGIHHGITKFQVAIGELGLEDQSRRLCHREATRRGRGSSVGARRKPLGALYSVAAVFVYSAVLTLPILVLPMRGDWNQLRLGRVTEKPSCS
jgi:hypothetical protein